MFLILLLLLLDVLNAMDYSHHRDLSHILTVMKTELAIGVLTQLIGVGI